MLLQYYMFHLSVFMQILVVFTLLKGSQGTNVERLHASEKKTDIETYFPAGFGMREQCSIVWEEGRKEVKRYSSKFQ